MSDFLPYGFDSHISDRGNRGEEIVRMCYERELDVGYGGRGNSENVL